MLFFIRFWPQQGIYKTIRNLINEYGETCDLEKQPHTSPAAHPNVWFIVTIGMVGHHAPIVNDNAMTFLEFGLVEYSKIHRSVTTSKFHDHHHNINPVMDLDGGCALQFYF